MDEAKFICLNTHPRSLVIFHLLSIDLIGVYKITIFINIRKATH